MKRKISVTNYADELIIAKLDYILVLAKLMVAEMKYSNSLWQRKNVLKQSQYSNDFPDLKEMCSFCHSRK